MKTIDSRMTIKFETLKITDSLRRAISIFSKTHDGIIAVVNDEQELIGILTKNRVLRALNNGFSQDSPIEPFVHRNPICLMPESTSTDIRQIFLENSINHAPVVDSKNRPIGIVSTPHILAKWQQTFESSVQFHQYEILDKLDTGLININQNFNMISINSIASKLLNISSSKEFSELLNENECLNNIVNDAILNVRKTKKFKIHINGNDMFIQCIPKYDNKIINGVIIILEKISNDNYNKTNHKESPESFNEKLRLALEISDDVELFSDAIALVNDRGIITDINKGFEELFNEENENLIGQNLLDTLPDIGIRSLDSLTVPIQGINKFINAKKCIISIIPIRDNNIFVGAACKIMYRDLEKLYFALEKLNTNNKDLGVKYTFKDIVGNSRKIKQAKEFALAASQSKSTVLLLGESGTGKELFAHGIHAASSLPGPLIKVNCAAIPEHLLESEFFGYEAGAFTGASNRGRKGKFELANNGTIFLDEIGDMSLSLQSKLLRVLQEKEFEPVGSSRTVQVNTRVIAATNKNLLKLVKEGKFREDLYYRINVLSIEIPPLHDRKEDIPIIVETIINKLSKEGFTKLKVSDQAMRYLIEYDWPGNIRELHNVIERAANITCNSMIDVKHLPPHLTKLHDEPPLTDDNMNFFNNKQTFFLHQENNSEKELIINILKQVDGNKSKASEILGKSRTWLYMKLKEYNINY